MANRKTEWDLRQEKLEETMRAYRAAQRAASDVAAKTSGFGIGEAGQVPATTVQDEIEAERLQPTPRTNLAKCAKCGRQTPRNWLHWTNTQGSVCPACYDRMDENE